MAASFGSEGMTATGPKECPNPTTSVRCLISPLSRSSGLVTGMWGPVPKSGIVPRGMV